MKKGITLVMIPPWEPKMPPLGLAYIAEYLRSRGIPVKVIDFNLALCRKADNEKGVFWQIHNINFMSTTEIADRIFDIFRDDIDKLAEEVVSLESELVGFSVNLASIGVAGKIASLIKGKDRRKKIIFGGTGCFWEEYRRFISSQDLVNIDAIVIGEGEEVLEKIIDRESEEFPDAEGLIRKKEDFFRPVPAYFTQDINSLPFPRFSDFDLCAYTEKKLPVLISRGCIGRCSFCIDHLMCGKYRFRDPASIIEEFDYHVRKNKITHFSFNDLICNGNLRQLDLLCDEIIKSGLNITWDSYAMIRKEMTSELLKKMKRSGCIWLCYGVESGCDRTLKKMNKFYDSCDAEKVVRMTHEAGIRAAINIIVGFPGEKKEDFEETLAFIRRNREYISEVTNVSSFVIMPPSRVGRNLQEYNIKLAGLNRDLNSFIDDSGTDFRERITRTRKTIFVLSSLGIKNVIMNQAGLNLVSYKNSIALLSLPPSRVDMPSLGLARAASCLRLKKFHPLVVDFNIKLYNSVNRNLKDLWESKNLDLWNFPEKILFNPGELAEKTFDLINELAAGKTNIFYFSTDKNNLIFSAKIASLLKKWLPSVIIVFNIGAAGRNKIKDLVPPGSVDIFVEGEPEEALVNILESDGQGIREVANTVSFKNGRYVCNRQAQYAEAEEQPVNFEGFDLREYKDLRLPLDWGCYARGKEEGIR